MFQLWQLYRPLVLILFIVFQVSDGGVHSHINHLESLIDAAKELGVPKCFIQFFSDGRDTTPTSGGEIYQSSICISYNL